MTSDDDAANLILLLLSTLITRPPLSALSLIRCVTHEADLHQTTQPQRHVMAACRIFSTGGQIRGLETKRKSSSGVQGWSPGGSLGAKPPEADEKL